MLNSENQLFFPQPSTDDKTDFEVSVSGDDFLVFKSPALTTVSIAKKNFKNSLKKIVEDLNFNFTQLKMDKVDRIETKQKINIAKNFIERFDSANKQNIEKQLQTREWIIKLIEDQLQKDKTFYTFGEKFRKSRLKKKDRLDSNVILQKIKLFPLTLEERLKDSPSVFAKIPADRVKGIEAAKDFFSNIIKQTPAESYKKFKIDYDEKII